MVEVSWQAIVTLCAVVGAVSTVAGFWMRFSDRITAAQNKGETAHIAATAATLRVETMQRDFSEYQTRAASQFVTDGDLAQTERRISTQFDELKNDIRGISERLDRVLETRQQ